MPPIPPQRSDSAISKQIPLPLSSTLSDIAALRRTPAVDLSTLLAPEETKEEPDVILDASYEYVKQARAAMAIGKSGSVEAQGEKMEKVREVLEDIVRGLDSNSRQ